MADLDVLLIRLAAIEAKVDALAATNAPATAERMWMDSKQAAKYLGCSTQRLEVWRSSGGGGPKYHKPSAGIVRYRRDQLDEFMESRSRQNTAGDASIVARPRSPGRPKRTQQ